MAGLDALRAEHALILETLDQLEERAAATGGVLPSDYMHAVFMFIRVFVDENHHGKEERVLFRHMEADPFLQSISSVLTADHREGRDLVEAMHAALAQGRPVLREIGAYAAFLRDHIRRENEMIFTAVESTLDEATLQEIDTAFVDIEVEVLGSGGTQRLLVPLQAASV